MDVGIGIPNSIRGTTGADLIEWARRAEAAGFSSLASIGGVEYPTYEELTVFAAAAAVTERIRFMTNVMISPTRSAAELAKQAATVDQLSGGRLSLGLSVGWRESDYDLTGRSFGDRGDRFEQQLRDLQTAWAGEPLLAGTRPVSPPPVQDGGVPVLIGGTTDAAIRRVIEFGQGWTAGGMAPDDVGAFGDRVRSAWAESSRPGEPKIVALVYFGLGGTEQRSREYLLDYYGPKGSDIAEMIAGSALRSPDAVAGAVQAFADAGVDELMLDPTVSDPEQVDLLADAAL